MESGNKEANEKKDTVNDSHQGAPLSGSHCHNGQKGTPASSASKSGQQSAPPPLTPSQQKVAECMLGTSQYLDLLQAVCGAGSHLSCKYASLLSESGVSGVAGRFHGTLRELESRIVVQRQAAQVALDAAWMAASKAQPSSEGSKDSTSSENKETLNQEEQLLAASFLHLLQTQCRFFLWTSEALSQFSELQTVEDMCNSPLNTQQVEGSTGSAAETKDSKPSIVDSPSRLRKLSSFFSKLGRSSSGVGELPQSSFYVDMPNNPPVSGSEEGCGHEKREVNQAGVGTNSAGVTNAMGRMGLSATVLQPGGQVASQEELDNVIDLLSGGHKVAPAMQSIPENFPPSSSGTAKSHAQKAVGSHLHSNQHPYNAGPEGLEAADYYGHHPHHAHRRSDGLIGETLGSHDNKTNTWPYRPATRSSSLSSDVSSQFSGTFAFDNFTNDVEYSRYLAAVKQMKHGASHFGNQVMPSQAPWAVGEPGAATQKGWGMFVGDGTEAQAGGRNWSAVGDSSSCSDESSNGEAPWMMGIDLVGTINEKRRHSSGEESFPSGPSSSTTESRPKSVEDLLDAKSTNTWPPKQPWAKSGPKGEAVSKENLPYSILHAPLTTQWSDPLASRPQGLSAWSAGIPSALSQQSLPSYTPMSPGGPGSEQQAAAHSKLERKYSVLT